MATVPPQLEAVAAAIERLRTATGPVARVQAVRAAADAVGGLTPADRQVLARGLLAHGAPVAGRALDGNGDGQVPPDTLLAVAQDLLALAPIETEQLAAELRGAAALGTATAAPDTAGPRDAAGPRDTAGARAAAVAAATTRPVAPARSRATDTPVGTARTARTARTGGSASSVSTPPPVPEAVRRRALGAADAGGAALGPAATSGPRPRDGGSRHGVPLAEQVRAEPDLRARLARLTALTTGRGPLTAPEVLELLRVFPDGWQRRTALRRLLTTPGVDVGADAVAVVEQFGRAGDRFTVAAQLVRDAGVPTTQVLPALGAKPGLRLQARAGRVPAEER